MADDWWKIKLEEQRENFAVEIVALRQTLMDVREHFNRISEYKKLFLKDDQAFHILKTWEPFLKDIFEVADKYKGLVDAKKEKRNPEGSGAS